MVMFNFIKTIDDMSVSNTDNFKNIFTPLLKDGTIELTRREHMLALSLTLYLIEAYEEYGDAIIQNMFDYVSKDDIFVVLKDKKEELKSLKEETRNLFSKIFKDKVNLTYKVFWMRGMRKYYISNTKGMI